MKYPSYPVYNYEIKAGWGDLRLPQGPVHIESTGETYEPDEVFEMWSYIFVQRPLSSLVEVLQELEVDTVLIGELNPDLFEALHNIRVQAIGPERAEYQPQLNTLVAEYQNSLWLPRNYCLRSDVDHRGNKISGGQTDSAVEPSV